jgi:hypothetical protein
MPVPAKILSRKFVLYTALIEIFVLNYVALIVISEAVN